MGQAKQRGTPAERARQAMEATQLKPVSELIEELGLPPTSKYLGYVIHAPATDDYLAAQTEHAGMNQRMYVKTPDRAMLFTDYGEAVNVASNISSRTKIGILFDVDDKHIVAFND